MIKKTITFKDLDGNDLTEDFYFGISTAEVTELVVMDEDLMGFFEKIAEHQEGEPLPLKGGEVMRVFKAFISMSVGKRSEDGRRFIKNDDIRDDFMQTDAYPTLFMDLVTNPNEAAEFINGIVPGNLAEVVAKMPKDAETTDIQLPSQNDAPEMPAWYTEGRIPNESELVNASPELLREAFRRKAAQPSQ